MNRLGGDPALDEQRGDRQKRQRNDVADQEVFHVRPIQYALSRLTVDLPQ